MVAFIHYIKSFGFIPCIINTPFIIVISPNSIIEKDAIILNIFVYFPFAKDATIPTRNKAGIVAIPNTTIVAIPSLIDVVVIDLVAKKYTNPHGINPFNKPNT